jgi:GAF domain-containing protein
MSAVNKQGADHFTSRDMETYKRFADLAAMVIRQRLREQALERSLKGDREAVPPELGDLRFGKDDALLLSVVQDIAELTQKREDLLPLIKRLSSLLLEISGRMDWGHWE